VSDIIEQKMVMFLPRPCNYDITTRPKVADPRRLVLFFDKYSNSFGFHELKWVGEYSDQEIESVMTHNRVFNEIDKLNVELTCKYELLMTMKDRSRLNDDTIDFPESNAIPTTNGKFCQYQYATKFRKCPDCRNR